MDLFNGYVKSIDDLHRDVLGCRNCQYAVLNTNRNCRVNGCGPINSKIMVVGQCPGKNEVETGIPFSGTSGKFLKASMRSKGLPPEKCRLTNVIRCLPPEGKNIMQKPITACSRWLYEEFHIVKPKMIICLGNIPATLILGNNKYSLSSNEVLETIYGVSGIATYHPAYIMRLRSSYESDEEEFRAVMDSFLRSIEVAKDYIGDLQ